MKQFVGVAAVVCLAAFALWGQTDQGSITGTISDPSGAAVPSAVVEIKNSNTGAIFRAGSSNTGNYSIPVPTGTYELTVAVPGFKKFVRAGIAVPAATSVRADAALEVGATNESVTVVDAGAPLLQTESGEISHNVDVDTLDSLPVLQISSGIRSPYATLNLLPGTLWTPNFDVRINGMPSNTQAMKVDGQDATNSLWQVLTNQTQPSVDAVQEVAVQTSNYAAEFGEAGGAVVNLTMRSGTNQLHGSAYDYMTNEDLNAGLPYTNDGNGDHIRNRTRLNDYGFTLGGPVYIPKIYNGHDKTFFFFNWEQWRNNAFTSNGLGTVPNPNTLGAGNFSLANQGYSTTQRNLITDSLGQTIYQGEIFDPLTDQTIGTDRVRSPFPNQTIPVSRMDPVSLKLQAMMPKPTDPTKVFQNYAVPVYSNDVVQTIPGFKIDQSLSATQKLSIYYSLNKQTSPANNGYPSPINGVIPQNQRTHTTRINYDNTLRPTLLLHLGVGLLHTVVINAPSSFDASTIGFTAQYSKFMPYITGLSSNFGTNGGYAQSIGPYTPIYLTNDKPTANASLTWIHGNHIYKAGGELIINGFPAVTSTYSNNDPVFSPNETNSSYLVNHLGLPAGAGANYASFLLGGVDSGTIGPVADARLGQHSLGLFLQDTWKITRRLTLDYGLRWDYETYLKEEYGRIPAFAPTVMNPTTGTLGALAFEGNGPNRCNCQIAHNYPYAFGPRIGVAYQINDKTVLRAGSAISYAKTAEDGYLSYSIGSLNSYGSPIPYQAYYNLSGSLPPALQGLTYPNFNIGQYPAVNNGLETGSSTSWVIDRNAGRPARIFQWSVGLQRELSHNMFIQANYIGNRGAWWQAGLTPQNVLNPTTIAADGFNLNSATDLAILATPISAELGKDARVHMPFAGFPTSFTVAQSLRPFPQFSSTLSPLWAPVGKTWYDSLQAGVTKRYSHGLEIQGNFTWEKATDIGAENSYPLGAIFGGGPTAVTNNIFNYDSNKFLSRDDRPFQLVISGSYTTPQLHMNKLVNEVLHNWRVSAVLRYQSGALIQIPGTTNGLGNILGIGTYAVRNPGVSPFNVDPNCHCFDPTTSLLLNPAAFSQAAPGQFSPSTPFYSDYRWQRQPMENMGFGRIFAFGKEGRYNIEVRGEFTNIFNRHFYGQPQLASTSLTAATTYQPGTKILTGGYGFDNTANGVGAVPRAGQFVARFRF